MEKIAAKKIKTLLDDIPSENDDVSYFVKRLKKLGFFDQLSENRKLALVALCHIYGFQGILNQTSLMLALESHDYARAEQELLKQGLRFTGIANVLKNDMLNLEGKD